MANGGVDPEGGGFMFSLAFRERDKAPLDIAALGERLAAYCVKAGVGATEGNSLHIALEELLTNLAKYGRPAAGGDAVLRAEGSVRVNEGEIVLAIADNSVPFDPACVAAPDLSADPMARAIGGLGIFMLFQLFQEHRYRRTEAGNSNEWILRRGTSS